jgi:hypothetical protein
MDWRTILTDWWSRPGSLLLLVGYSALGLLVLDRYLQHRERMDALRVVASLADQEARIRDVLLEKHRDSPELYRAAVKIPYRGMGGTHGLRGGSLREGDVLEVLEEGAGPSGLYLLVRTRNDAGSGATVAERDAAAVQVGWYPRAYVERLDEETPSNSKTQVGTASGRSFWKWLRGNRR